RSSGQTENTQWHWGEAAAAPVHAEKYKHQALPATPPQQYSTLHGLVGSKDGLIYVSDRRGNRIQVFRQSGEFLTERFVRPETGGSGGGLNPDVFPDPEPNPPYHVSCANDPLPALAPSHPAAR